MEEDTYNFLLAQAANSYKSSAFKYGAGAFAEAAGAFINYGALKTEVAQYKLEAQNVELQALERANMLRQQLVEAYGNYQYNAAARGISIGSGSVRDNLINSSMEFGEDIQTMSTSARLRAEAARAQGKIAKIRGKVQLAGGLLDSVTNISKAYGAYKTAEKINNG